MRRRMKRVKTRSIPIKIRGFAGSSGGRGRADPTVFLTGVERETARSCMMTSMPAMARAGIWLLKRSSIASPHRFLQVF
jgi:hypothetical protein